MKKIMITIPITVAITAAMLAASIGTFESVYAQTNATNTTNANNNTADIRSASDLENLTRGGNASLSQNRGDIANPTIGLTRWLEREQTANIEDNLAAADKTAGQIVTTTGNGSSSSSDANTTTTANNTSANQISSENRTENSKVMFL
jgi:hypothetical protein